MYHNALKTHTDYILISIHSYPGKLIRNPFIPYLQFLTLLPLPYEVASFYSAHKIYSVSLPIYIFISFLYGTVPCLLSHPFKSDSPKTFSNLKFSFSSLRLSYRLLVSIRERLTFLASSRLTGFQVQLPRRWVATRLA